MAGVRMRLGRLRRRVRARAAGKFRLATRRARILPSFLIIGAQRAGTTSLFDYLLQHPDVCGPLPGGEVWWSGKELHFFDDRFWRGISWYRAFFPTVVRRRAARLRGGDLVAGEATPYYLFHPLVPEGVAATIPTVRLIALLRDPVERAWSHYKIMRRSRREPLSFDDALAAEEDRLAGERRRLLTDPRFHAIHHRDHAYVARGLYAEQLERWFEFFPRDRLLVLRCEDLRDRPSDVYREVLAFVGLRPYAPARFEYRNRSELVHGKPGPRQPLDPAIRARLEERFAEPNARLYELLGRDFGWRSARAPAR